MQKLLLALVLSLGSAAQGQLTLNAGDTYTYQFSTLPFVGIESSDQRQLFGMAGVVIDPASFGPGDSIRLEMFENSLAESPISVSLASDSLQSFGFGSQSLVGIAASSLNHWSDHQGAIRLTEVSGSSTIETIGVEYVANRDLTTANAWRDIFTPVPEPGTAALLVMAFFAGLAALLRKKVLTTDHSDFTDRGLHSDN